MAFWCKPDNVTGSLYQALFSVGDTNADEHFILTTMKYGDDYGLLVVFCRAAGVTQWGFISSLIAPIFVAGTNSWRHIAIVQDGVAPKLYVDGVDQNVTLSGSTPATWFAGLTGADNVRVGCQSYNSGGNTWFFDGGISDVKVYSKALTAYEVQQLTRMGGQFTFGQHLESIEAVYVNGIACDYTVDQLTGPSLVSITEPYDGTADSVSAHVYGRISSDTGHTNVPTAWMYDLLTQSWAMGLSASTRVDAASFTAAHAEYGASDVCRRWIGADVQVATLLAELCHDGFVELVLGDDGKYRPKFRTSTSLSSVPLYREVDIIQSGGSRAIRALADPERTYANQIAYDYRTVPPLWSGETLQQQREFGAGGVEDDTAEQTTTARTTRRRIYCRWLYAAAQARAQLDLQAFALRLEIVDLLLGPRGLMLEKGDFFQLIYGNRFGASNVVGTLYQVRSVAPDYGNVTAAVTGWNIDSLSPRRYHGDGDVAWALATLRAKASLGYYGAFTGDDDQLYA